MRFLLNIVVLLASLLMPYPCFAAQNDRFTGPATHSQTGVAKYGFALALTAEASSVPLGTPIWVTVEIRNVSGGTEYASAESRAGGYDFTIVNSATGKSVPRNLRSTFGLDAISVSMRGRTVPANTSFYSKFRLDELYEFTERGTYTVEVTTARLRVNGQNVQMGPSNKISITVT